MSCIENSSTSQTRSGRVSQIPKRMLQDYEVKWFNGPYLKCENILKKQANFFENPPPTHKNGRNSIKKCYVKLNKLDDHSKFPLKKCITQSSEVENNTLVENPIQKLVPAVKEEPRTEISNVLKDVKADNKTKVNNFDELVNFYINQYNENVKKGEKFCGIEQCNEDSIKEEKFCKIKQENVDLKEEEEFCTIKQEEKEFFIIKQENVDLKEEEEFCTIKPEEKAFFIIKQENDDVMKEEKFCGIKEECDDPEDKVKVLEWIKKEEEIGYSRNEDGFNDYDIPLEFPEEKHKVSPELDLIVTKITQSSSQRSGIVKSEAGLTSLDNNQEGNENDSNSRLSTLRSWKNIEASSSHWTHQPEFSSSSILKKDSNSVVCVNDLFLCPKCDYKVSNSELISKHVKKEHDLDEAFVCKVCNFRTALHSGLRKHYIMTHVRQRSFRCGQCKYTASKVILLNIHTIVAHAKEKPFKCNKCNYSASKLHYLKTHHMLHDAVKQEGEIYCCSLCTYFTPNITSFRKHYSMHRWQKNRTSDGESSAFRKHNSMQGRQRNRKSEGESSTFRKRNSTHSQQKNCKSVGESSTFRKHNSMHDRQDNLKSDHESSVKKNHTETQIVRKNLEEETKSKTNKKRYKCSICNYTTYHPSLFITHTTLHSSEHTELRKQIKQCFKK